MLLLSGVFSILTITAPCGAAQENHLLKAADVGQVMHQILEHHVEKSEVSGQVLQQSLTSYVDKFDPDRIYLLEKEVAPWVDLNSAAMQQLVSQYKQGDYSAYSRLNAQIQASIARAREMRQSLEKNKASLFAEDLPKEHKPAPLSDINLSRSFPKSIDELRQRQKQQLVQYIGDQRLRFGKNKVNKKEDEVLAQYEKDVRNIENTYMFQNSQGLMLSKDQQEHYFILHVLKSLAGSLDAHTTFFNADEAQEMRSSLEKEFHGVGVVLQEGLGDIVIQSVIEGSPAQKSGKIIPNDVLVEIDGKSVSKMPFHEVLEKMRGENGTSVTLGLKREVGDKEQPVKVTLQRAEIALNDKRVNIQAIPFGNGIIGAITLYGFYDGDSKVTSEIDVRNAIHQLQKTGHLRGLILDLRENSGGYLMQAVKVAGLFIKSGVIVISKYSNGDEKFYRDMNSIVEYNGPLVVLTSRATASAAEIVAEALQDYGVALVVGDDHTYGKGSIQTQTVTDNSSLSNFKVTVGKYYTVSGKSPQIRGVQADVVVPGPYMVERIGEAFLDNALKPDTIKPAFDDPLQDVQAKDRAWYYKYYVPTLQHPTDMWTKLVPALQKNSTYRLSKNKDYKLFLRLLNGQPGSADESEQEDEENSVATNQKQTNFGVEDLQMAESVNIVKDMVMLHSHILDAPLTTEHVSAQPKSLGLNH